MKTKLIKNGTVVLGQTVSVQDLLIAGEKIAAIGQLSEVVKPDETIDATGLLVLPGGVDTHVHLNDPFMGTVSVHDYFHGMRAAAFGGTTSVIDFSNQPKGGSLRQALESKFEESAGKAVIDWATHLSLHEHPSDETLAEIKEMVAAGSPTIKCYMTYRGEGLLVEKEDLRRVMIAIAEAGGMLLLHCEDNDMAEEMIPTYINEGMTAPIYHARSKPPAVENKAMENVIALNKETGARTFIVHLTTKEGVDMVGAARGAGQNIIAETCTHYLVMTDAMLEREDGLKWICSPPLRDELHQEMLWQGLADGRLFQVTSDDATYGWESKLYGKDRFDLCPNGMPGIEPRFTTLFSAGVATGRISLPRFVELVATNPAYIFGMAEKGTLDPGKDADIVLFDPNVSWTMGQANTHSNNDWHAYEGFEVTGKVQRVFSRGELIVNGDEFLAEPGRGRYVERRLPKSVN